MKKIGGIIFGILIGLCALLFGVIALCAADSSLSPKIAEFLYEKEIPIIGTLLHEQETLETDEDSHEADQTDLPKEEKKSSLLDRLFGKQEQKENAANGNSDADAEGNTQGSGKQDSAAEGDAAEDAVSEEAVAGSEGMDSLAEDRTPENGNVSADIENVTAEMPSADESVSQENNSESEKIVEPIGTLEPESAQKAANYIPAFTSKPTVHKGASGLKPSNKKGTSEGTDAPVSVLGQTADVDDSADNGVDSLKDEVGTEEYETPNLAEVKTPDGVENIGGYEEIQSHEEQLDDTKAKEIEEELGYGETGENLRFDTSFYPYYAMMDSQQKQLYQQIYANVLVLTKEFKPIVSMTPQKTMGCFEALFNDHPELFWLNTSYGVICNGAGKCIELDLEYNETAERLEAAQAEFGNAVMEIVSGASAAADLVSAEQYVHDAIIDHCAYNTTAPMNQSAYSALVNGQSVCAGYARAFQYCLQLLSVPCYYCTGYAGQPHAWNIVRNGDEFRNIDLTWDDTGKGKYDFFICTDAEFRSHHARQNLSVYLPACK